MGSLGPPWVPLEPSGLKPNQVFTDAIKDRTILEDISSRDYIRAYKDLKTRKTVEKEAIEQDKRFVFDDPLATAASKNIAKKDKVPMLSKENLAEIKKTAKEILQEGLFSYALLKITHFTRNHFSAK